MLNLRTLADPPSLTRHTNAVFSAAVPEYVLKVTVTQSIPGRACSRMLAEANPISLDAEADGGNLVPPFAGSNQERNRTGELGNDRPSNTAPPFGLGTRGLRFALAKARTQNPARVQSFREPFLFLCPSLRWHGLNGGEGGIRTHGTLAGTPDFESGTFDQAPPPLRGRRD